MAERTEVDDERIFSFAIQAGKKMKELGIVSLIQNDQEIRAETKDRSYKLSSSDNTKSVIEFNPAAGLLTSSYSKKNGLTGPALKMALSLHELLKNLHNLPAPAPTMNPSKFDVPELYNQVLLRKLERGVVSLDDDDFLSGQKMVIY